MEISHTPAPTPAQAPARTRPSFAGWSCVNFDYHGLALSVQIEDGQIWEIMAASDGSDIDFALSDFAKKEIENLALTKAKEHANEDALASIDAYIDRYESPFSMEY